MQTAIDRAADEPPAVGAMREAQDTAAQRLAEALALLQPPQPQQEKGEQSQPQPQDGDGEDEEQEEPKPQEADPARLLQAVRDREAERRKAKDRKRAGYEPVEKDW